MNLIDILHISNIVISGIEPSSEMLASQSQKPELVKTGNIRVKT